MRSSENDLQNTRDGDILKGLISDSVHTKFQTVLMLRTHIKYIQPKF